MVEPSFRGRQTYALLRSAASRVPPLGSRSDGEPGFVNLERGCLHCREHGRWSEKLGRKVAVGCPHCGGTGRRPVKDRLDDPPKLSDEQRLDPRRKSTAYGVSGELHRDELRRRDRIIERLKAEELVRAGEESPLSVVESAFEESREQDKLGDYRTLRAALDRLRDVDEGAYRVCMGVVYMPFSDEPIEPVRRVVVAACELLARWMPDRIRVPLDVPIWTRAELERQSREAQAALKYGRSEWARATRAERKRVIVLLHGEGLSDGKIAARFGLTRQWVQRVRSGVVLALDESNGHEEAA